MGFIRPLAGGECSIFHTIFVCSVYVFAEKSSEKDVNTKRGCWLTTTPSGARICTVGTTHKHTPSLPLLIYKTTDPITHEVRVTGATQVTVNNDIDVCTCGIWQAEFHLSCFRISTSFVASDDADPGRSGGFCPGPRWNSCC